MGTGGTGIAFEGCGCRAAFHVGVMEWFAERGFQPSAVAGASSGSVIAAAVALGRIEALRPAWQRLLGTPVFQWRRALRGRWPFAMTDIVGNAARSHFEGASMHEARLPLAIVVTQWRGRRLVPRVVTRADRVPVVRAILASCYIPGPYSRMFTIDRRPCFDGAWLASVPLQAARDIGAERVIACVADFEGRILRGALWRRRVPASAFEQRVLSPTEPLPLGTFDFDARRTARCFAIGRASAARFASQNEGWLG